MGSAFGGDRNLLLRLAAESGDFDQVLDRAEARLRQFGTVSADANVDLKGLTEVNAQVDELEAKLRAFGAQTFRPQVKVDFDRSKVDEATKALEALHAASAGGGGGGGSAEAGAKGLADFGAAASGAASAAVALGVALLVLSAGGLAALISSLGAAVLGAGALAAAFAGALGPAAVVAVGAFQGLGSVFNFLQLDKKAQDAKQFGQATLQSAQAAQQHRTAVQALAQSTQSLSDAQRNYALAVRSANDQLQAAQHTALTSTQNLALAQDEVKRATTDAYDAWKHSILDVRDAIEGVRNAQLGIEQSHLDLSRAEFELKKFRQQAHLTDSTLNGLFKSLTGNRLDPNQFRQILGKVGSRGDLTTQQRLDLEQLILNVKKAKEGERGATNTLATSEQRLTEARRNEARFARQGINAYQPLLAARRTLASATYSQMLAERDLRRLQADGIKNAPAVISAAEAVKNARIQLGNATRALRLQEQGAATDAAKAAQAYKAIPAALRPLARAIQTLMHDFREFGKGIAVAMAPVLTEGAKALDALLKRSRGTLTKLGQSLATGFANIFRSFRPGELSRDLTSLARDAGPMFENLGKVVGGLLRIFLTIARAALPELTRVFGAWGDKVNKTADNLNGPRGFKGLKDTIHGLVSAFRDWMGLLGALGNVFLQFFTGTHGPGDNLVVQFTGWLNGLADTIHKHRGDITDFFNQTIPGLKAALGLLGDVLAGLVTALPAFVAVAVPVVGALRGIARVLGDLVGTKGGLATLAALGSILLLRFGTKLWTGLSPTARVISVLSIALAGLGQLPKGIRQALEGIAIGLAAVVAVRGLPAQWRALKALAGTLSELRKSGGVGAVLKRIFGFGKGNPAGTAAGEGVAAGGKAAGEEIAGAMVAAGREVAAMIAGAMRTGGIPGPGGSLARDAEKAAGGGLLSRILGSRVPLGRLGSIGAAELGGGVLAGAYGTVTGALPAAQSNSMAPYLTRALKTFQGYANKVTLGLIPSPSSFNAKLKELENESIRNMDLGLAIGRHAKAGILAGLGGHSGLSTAIENQLRVSFNNLGQRATGGLSSLKKAFNANMDQIRDTIPPHTRSWTRAISQNMVSFVSAIGRNIGRGRIEVSQGMAAMERAMRSHMLRGRDAVRSALDAALRRIETFRQSSEQKIGEASRVGRIALHRLGLAFRTLKDDTDSEIAAMSDLVTAAGVSADTAQSIIESARKMHDAPSVPSSAFHHRRRRRRRHTGGWIDGDGDWTLRLGEYVVQPSAAAAFGPLMGAINAGPAALAAALSYGSGAHHAGRVAQTPDRAETMLARIMARADGGKTENHFHIPRPLDARRDPDPEHTAALLSQALERKGRF